MKLTEIVKDKADFRAVMGDPDYIGYFSDLSGEVAAGEVVSWGGFFWKALTTIADVTLNEPVDGNDSWCKLQPDVYAYVVAQIANGVYTDVGYICVGEEVSDYKYMIWPADGRVYTVGLVTGVVTSGFDPSTGSDSGLTGDLTRYGSVAIVENYLKVNQNLKVPSGTETLPSSTPTDYAAGAEIAYNLYAGTDVVGLVVDGTISGTGTIYMSYEGDFSSLPYGGQLPDGSISQTGFDIDYDVRKAGYTTVAVDLSLADAFKFFVLTPADGKCAEINDADSMRGIPITLWEGSVSLNDVVIDFSASGFVRSDFTKLMIRANTSDTGAPESAGSYGVMMAEDTEAHCISTVGGGTSVSQTRVAVNEATETTVTSFITASGITGEITKIVGVLL